MWLVCSNKCSKLIKYYNYKNGGVILEYWYLIVSPCLYTSVNDDYHLLVLDKNIIHLSFVVVNEQLVNDIEKIQD